MAWIDQWQKFVGFDQQKSDKHPGKIDNSDIIFEHSRNAQNEV